MNENIYLPEKKSSSSGNNLKIIIIAFIIIFILVFGITYLLKNLNIVQTTDNSIITKTPSPTAVITETPVSTELPSPSPTVMALITTTPGVSPTGTPVKLYFYKSPIKPNQDTNEIYEVDHYTSETGLALIPYAIKEFFNGPTAAEASAGYILPFTLSGASTCGGSGHKYSFDLPTLKVTICRQIDPTPESGDGGSYAGSSLKAMARVLKVITSSLKVGGVTKVNVYDSTGACYGAETGLNGCTP